MAPWASAACTWPGSETANIPNSVVVARKILSIVKTLLSGCGDEPRSPPVDGPQPKQETVRTTGYSELRSGKEVLRREFGGCHRSGDGTKVDHGIGRGDHLRRRGQRRGRHRTCHLRAGQLAPQAAIKRHRNWPQEEPDGHEHKPHNQSVPHRTLSLEDARRPVKDSQPAP